MKKVLLKYGGLGVAVMVLFFSMEFLITSFSEMDMSTQELIGYLGIFVSLIFVFFGVRSYRDQHLNGSISFGKALWVGVLIALIPAIAFGIYNVIYMLYINPDFIDQYYSAMYADLANNYSGEELIQKQKEMESSKEMFSSPVLNFFLMTFTVLIIGFIISVISALILRKKDHNSQLNAQNS